MTLAEWRERWPGRREFAHSETDVDVYAEVDSPERNAVYTLSDYYVLSSAVHEVHLRRRAVDTSGWTWFAWGAVIAEQVSTLHAEHSAWHCVDFNESGAGHYHIVVPYIAPDGTVTQPTPREAPAPAASEEAEAEAGDESDTPTCTGCGYSHADIALCDNCGECMSSGRVSRRGECCDCNECSRCETRSEDSMCDNCDRCNDCCNCSYCESGEHRYRGGGCDRCDACNDCCGCSSDDEDEDGAGSLMVRRKPFFFVPTKMQCKVNPSKRVLGVEIEVASYDGSDYAISRAAEQWRCSIVEDGSLPSGGFELVTSPAGGDVFVEQITALCGALTNASAKVTSDCGLHVHVDARDFRYYDIRRLVLLYQKIEPALFATQPSSRQRNRYCQPCGGLYAAQLATLQAPKESKKALINNVYGGSAGDTRNRRTEKYDGARYHALNLHSWLYRGTVECRLHTGSVNASKIIAWGMLWAGILDYAMRTPERVIRGLKLSEPAQQREFMREQLATTDSVRSYLDERWSQFGRSYVNSITGSHD